MLEIPEGYVSNTVAANANQTWMIFEKPDEIQCGVVFIRVYKGGEFNYIFGFSGVIDSTFSDGTVSHCNDVCPPWKIHGLSYCITDECGPGEAESNEFRILSFDGNRERIIDGEDIVFTDPQIINAGKNQYICLKIEFSGERVPCHKESIIAIYKKDCDGGWEKSTDVPVPVFTGVKRNVKKKIAFPGDSITQGIGTTYNSYKHYAALTAESIGDEYAYWDLGIGFSRGYDLASGGVLMEKAKQNDIVSVCYGVNDIFNGRTAAQIKNDLTEIVNMLHAAGTKVIIQTVPPFDYEGIYKDLWYEVNDFIRIELSVKADGFLDNVKFLSEDGDNSPRTKYGGHPDNDGNRIWAENLAPVIRELL